MKTLLVVHTSGRVTRSITRRLTQQFIARWKATDGNRVIERDVTADPLPFVNEAWIAGAFSEPATHSPALREALAVSDTLIDELLSADAIVIGAPLYNFGMPAQLKASIDQIVRAGRTFTFQQNEIPPYLPLVKPKPVAVITSAGDATLLSTGALGHLNHLEPHLNGVLQFIGLPLPIWIRVGNEEFADDHLRQTLAEAERKVHELASEWSAAPEHVLFTG